MGFYWVGKEEKGERGGQKSIGETICTLSALFKEVWKKLFDFC
jgi:hypothetical protein